MEPVLYLQFGIDFGIFFLFFIKVIYEWNGHSFVEIKIIFISFFYAFFMFMYYNLHSKFSIMTNRQKLYENVKH